jgi:hypothetical protein
MLRAVVWKEIREQGLIGLTLVVLGSGVLAAAAMLAEPPISSAPPSDVIRYLGVGPLATLMLAVTAGMVCGGAVFAAEREAGTAGFLESLPVSRARLWGAKFVAGLGLAVAQAGLLVGVAAALGLVPTLDRAAGVGLFSLLAFSWGLFGSTVARTTLGSVGIAIPAAVVASVLVLFPILLIFPTRGGIVGNPRPTGAALFVLGMFLIPVALSAWAFTATDRQRASRGGVGVGLTPIPADGESPRGRPGVGISAVFWLATRQLRTPGLVLSGFAVVCGLTLLAPGSRPVFTWPALALAAGVLAGVTAFADEQTRGSARYWGEQRLPVGRVWGVKIGLHLAFGLWLLILLALPLAIRAQFGTPPSGRGHTVLAIIFRSPLLDEHNGLGRNAWKFLVVPAVYGFAAGHLCGLLFRKLVVACGVAGIVGGVGATLWGPSLLAGGINHWQLWLPPVLLLLTARLLIPAWAGDRLVTRRPLVGLSGGCAAAALALAAGLGYRVLEIPDRPDGEADMAYVAGLQPIDENVGRREFRSAADRYARAVAAVNPAFVRPPAPRGTVGPGPRPTPEERVERIPSRGWPEPRDEELSAWLDRVVAHETELGDSWPAHAALAATRPIGVFEYPQLSAVGGSRDATLGNAQRMAATLLARGLQQQAEKGNPAAFVDALRTVIPLARTMRTGSIIAAFEAGSGVERVALMTVDRWLDQLDHSPERIRLLCDAIKILTAADPSGPFDPAPHYLAERNVLREALKSPTHWLPAHLAPPGANADAVAPEADLVGVAWAVPWERERTRRLVGLGYESGPSSDYRYLIGRPGFGLMIRPRLSGELANLERSLRVHRRAAILKLALRAYRADRGRYPDPNQPDALKELSEKYLGESYRGGLPTDPHLEPQPLRYRLARARDRATRTEQREWIIDEKGEWGEWLQPPPRPSGGAPLVEQRTDGSGRRFVQAGQAIIWSVGSDQTDNDGARSAGGSNGANPAADLIYLVPRGPAP